MTEPHALANGESLPDIEVPPFTDRLSFRFHQISAQMAKHVNPLFREYGIDLDSSRILVLILTNGEIGAGKVIEWVRLPQSTISHQFKRLEKLGYIVRTRNQNDQRAVTLTLTPQGEIVAQACEDMSRNVYKTMVAGLTAEELAIAKKAMAVILNNMESS